MNLDIKALKLLNILKHIGFITCLFSFLLTYYYFSILNYNILIISFFTFQFGLSLKIGTIIVEIVKNNI